MRFLCLVAAFILAMGMPGPVASAQSIPSRDAHALARSGKLLIIDVRPREDRRRTGVPVGAVEIDKALPLDSFLAAVERVTRRNKGTNLALICAAGVLSAEVQTNLVVAGYTRVASVADGMDGNASGPGWLANGLPVRRSRQSPMAKR